MKKQFPITSTTSTLSAVTAMGVFPLATIIGDPTSRCPVPLRLVRLLFMILTLIFSVPVCRIERRLPKEGILLK